MNTRSSWSTNLFDHLKRSVVSCAAIVIAADEKVKYGVVISLMDLLKQNEFKDLYQNEKPENYISEVSIDTDFELLFPDFYIKSVNERLQLYSELNKIINISQLNNFETMLEDRFGNLPYQVEDLLVTVKIKWLAIELGFEKVVMKKRIIKAYFIKDKNSDYFKSRAS